MKCPETNKKHCQTSGIHLPESGGLVSLQPNYNVLKHIALHFLQLLFVWFAQSLQQHAVWLEAGLDYSCSQWFVEVSDPLLFMSSIQPTWGCCHETHWSSSTACPYFQLVWGLMVPHMFSFHIETWRIWASFCKAPTECLVFFRRNVYGVFLLLDRLHQYLKYLL